MTKIYGDAVRYIGVFLLAVMLFLFCPESISNVYAASSEAVTDQRLFDQAGLLGEDEKAVLTEQIQALQKELKMDVVVVTTNDAKGRQSLKYADDFYIEGNFGVGNKYNGIIYLIDMDNREIVVNACGEMVRFMTDERKESMLDALYNHVSVGRYGDSAQKFLEDTEYYYNKGIQSNQYNYDEATGTYSVHRSIRWYEAVFALVAAVICALLPCRSVIRQYAMESEKRQASGYNLAYRANCNFAFHNQDDNLVNKYITQRIIPRNHGGGGGRPGGGGHAGRSTVHRSSGRSFSGSSRKF